MNVYIEKKELIIKTAQKLFSRFGFLKTTVDEIAKAARMGKASLYHYFKSKEDIFREVVEKESQILSGKTREAIERENTPQDKIKAFIVTRMECLSELANIYDALKNEYLEHYAFVEKAREANFREEIETIKAILQDGVNDGVFEIYDIELTSFAIITALKGLEYPWTIEIPSHKIEGNIDKLLDILFNGIVKR